MANAIHFSRRYVANLNAAINNYWLVSPKAADDFAEAHDRKVALLAQSPGVGEVRPGGRLSSPIGKSGYRIIYRLTPDGLSLIHLENVRRRRA